MGCAQTSQCAAVEAEARDVHPRRAEILGDLGLGQPVVDISERHPGAEYVIGDLGSAAQITLPSARCT
jgi:hypothetical protein